MRIYQLRYPTSKASGPPVFHEGPAVRMKGRKPPQIHTRGLKINHLGQTGISVTDACFGTMTFGEQNTESEAHEMLSFAADCGINFIDTAEVYPVAPRPETSGSTSCILGRWLKNRKREEFVIASKVTGRSAGLEWIPAYRAYPEEPTAPPSQPRLDSRSIVAAAEAELRRLQTDHIDLFQIHWPDRYIPLFGSFQYRPQLQHQDIVPFTEQVEAMGKLISQGKIRAWGLSNESCFGVMSFCAAAAALGVPPPATLQNHYSLLHRTYEGDLAETCFNLGVGLLVWSPLAGGALAGKYLGGKLPVGSRFALFGERYARFNTERVRQAVSRYVDIAHSAGMEPEHLALAFCRERWLVTSTIVGSTNMDQLRRNMKVFTSSETHSNGLTITPDVLRRIEAVHVELRNPELID
ncbi:hypothetical protein CEUSTIGMA_g2533.t1 [Chlamydomonas eustigma]|uniref:NADP-dependent oxidoreductase domain-containing protein n=1 Tax=Chlamydomonas eustigma TaxID=1157962 RepID=A0A250WWK9_9CHLO|nr:hypothetical protein CEUSTIGMA_g2533.t1 [Chlamydomonas eustigma]|eukprot:GAX75089.1 hypothetical protein CEUSTIGMA_g2533.t1 [Chlamydomonas eustigma]